MHPIRSCSLSVFCAITFMSLSPTLLQAEDGWQTLFNGEDLEGWVHNIDPDAYRVEDGILRLQATTNSYSHLFILNEDGELDTFRNFDLRFKAKADADSNSGVYIHTSMKAKPPRQGLTEGYEIQLNCAQKEKRKTGSLYAVVDLAKSPVDESNWFDVRIKVEEKNIQVFLNGKQVVDYTETEEDLKTRPAKRAGRKLNPKGGAIALQAHDKNSVWYFKDIKVKRLPSLEAE